MGITLLKFGFDVVHGCQLRCVGCPNSGLNPKILFVTKPDFTLCLGNVDVHEVELFRFFNFGEPTLHPLLPDLMLLIPKQRWSVGCVEISTNAQYHDFKMLEEVYKTKTLDRLVVSCDGDGTPNDYERLRPPSKWERLIAFLRKARELRDRQSSKTALITRTICTDQASQARWTEILKPLGWAPEFRDWLLLPEAKENPSGRVLKVGSGLCTFMARPTLYVDYDGTVIPCCIHPKAFELGNLKHDTYTKIQASERRRRFEGLLSQRNGMSICGKCEF
jgi:radical SAM protein with 4Fe4S-binding SPASM domain